MGKRGRIPKQANRTVGHRDNNISVLPGGRNSKPPKPNYNWLAKTRTYWQKLLGKAIYQAQHKK